MIMRNASVGVLYMGSLYWAVSEYDDTLVDLSIDFFCYVVRSAILE